MVHVVYIDWCTLKLHLSGSDCAHVTYKVIVNVLLTVRVLRLIKGK